MFSLYYIRHFLNEMRYFAAYSGAVNGGVQGARPPTETPAQNFYTCPVTRKAKSSTVVETQLTNIDEE